MWEMIIDSWVVVISMLDVIYIYIALTLQVQKNIFLRSTLKCMNSVLLTHKNVVLLIRLKALFFKSISTFNVIMSYIDC